MALAVRHRQRAALQAQAVGHRGAAASGRWGSGDALPSPPGQKYRLFYLSIKINSQVNPYDPQWEPYLEQRQGLKMAASLQGRRTLLSLWQRQDGRCPHCGEAIT